MRHNSSLRQVTLQRNITFDSSNLLKDFDSTKQIYTQIYIPISKCGDVSYAVAYDSDKC